MNITFNSITDIFINYYDKFSHYPAFVEMLESDSIKINYHSNLFLE